MLNRRLLRIKVMQSLYSYHQAVGADMMLAQDRIAAAFEPDLTAKEAPDRRLLEGQRKLGEAQRVQRQEARRIGQEKRWRNEQASQCDPSGRFGAGRRREGRT